MRASAVLAAALLLGACGAEAPPDRMAEMGGAGGAAREAGPVDPLPVPLRVGPPPVRLRAGGHQVSLRAWSYCWTDGANGVCADGWPPTDPPDIGDPEEIQVEFPVTGWQFTGGAERTGERCGRSQRAALEQTGPTTYRLRPLGPADDYVVTLFGRGKDAAGTGGDLVVSFRWHTPHDGPRQVPTASIGILAGTPADVRTYGVELSVRDLRGAPNADQVTASVVVTSSNGSSMSADLEPKHHECAPEGSFSFEASEELGRRAAALGPAPFRYDVALTIDAVTYRGRATWPDDQDPECSPCTRLEFSPPLPGE